MFIQVIQGRCNDADALHRQMDRWREELEPSATGWLGGTYGITDDDEFVGVVRFDSRASAEANSVRPEQGAWWEETLAPLRRRGELPRLRRRHDDARRGQ